MKINKILEAVSANTGIPIREIKGGSRASEVVAARRKFSIEAHNAGYTQVQIAKTIKRDRVTVSHYLKTKGWVDYYKVDSVDPLDLVGFRVSVQQCKEDVRRIVTCINEIVGYNRREALKKKNTDYAYNLGKAVMFFWLRNNYSYMTMASATGYSKQRLAYYYKEFIINPEARAFEQLLKTYYKKEHGVEYK